VPIGNTSAVTSTRPQLSSPGAGAVSICGWRSIIWNQFW